MRTTKNKKDLLQYYMKIPYSIRIIPEEAGGYFVEIEELSGCMTQGDTIEEVMKNINEAKELWLESAIEDGFEIPKPKEMEEYSGKFLVRLPKYIHKRISHIAEREGVSLNQMIVSLLSERSIIKEIRSEIKSIYWKMDKMKTELYELNSKPQLLSSNAKGIYKERISSSAGIIKEKQSKYQYNGVPQ
jgi:predicted RNase H-like HicB family nuclease